MYEFKIGSLRCCILFVLGWSWALHAADPGVEEARIAMERSSQGKVLLHRSRVTGLGVFLQTEPGRPIPVNAAAAAPARERGESFLAQHGAAFGISRRNDVRWLRSSEPDELGMEHVRFQQTHQGIPVAGAEIMVHLRDATVRGANGKTLPDLDGLDINPRIPAAEAAATARALVAKHVGAADTTFSEPRLEILNRGLLNGSRAPTHLAWFVEARRFDLRWYIWVDAGNGGVALQFNQLAHALFRAIYNGNHGSALPGTLVRTEGGPATGDKEADLAYDLSGMTYNYFLSAHGRDSYNGLGATLMSTVHHCPNTDNCPYQNAFWNGTQMVYGEGFLTKDIVAHELTHAVTEFSANLYYYFQSGALNESFSDIFGETVDLLNPGGDDSPEARWLMGEDCVIGAIRHMYDPRRFRNPGKVSDVEFMCNAGGFDGPADGGGVHQNSGVPNHAYALMVDGGNYNGYSINGIGLVKAAKIHYRVLTRYLLSASDFLDHYYALKQACRDLIGVEGITAADCEEVDKVVEAVELSKTWPCEPLQLAQPAACGPLQSVTNLLFNNFDSSQGPWTLGTSWAWATDFASSGTRHLRGNNNATASDIFASMNISVLLSNPGARMLFNHSYGFENFGTNFHDGGVIEFSTNNGATWADAGDMIVAGAVYGGTIRAGNNPLAGRRAFVGDSYGYTTTQLDLSSLAGQTVRFRFRIGTDSSVGDYGWFIDDVQIYECDGPVISANVAVTGESCAPANEAIDPGETVSVALLLQNTGNTLSGPVTATLLATDGVTPSGAPEDYGALLPGTEAVSRTFNFTANGQCGGEVAVKFHLVSDTNDLGTLTFPFRLGKIALASNSFTNTNRISVAHASRGDRYPSALHVSGLAGAVSKVLVNLQDVTYRPAWELDILLQAPDGTAVVLMSDVGWTNTLAGYTLSFDDGAPSFLPFGTFIKPGIYKPSNFGVELTTDLDRWPLPATGGPYPDKLAAFSNSNANGVWRLFVVDDGAYAGVTDPKGSIGGWTLTLITSNAACCTRNDLSVVATRTPDPVTIGENVGYAFVITNSGPDATTASFQVTFPASASLSGGVWRSGACVVESNIINCNFGVMDPNAAESVAFHLTPDALGLMNVSAVTSGTAVDGNPANNSVTVSTRVLPAVSISVSDATALEQDTTTAHAVFAVHLAAPSEQDITIQYETLDGTALSAVDYVQTNGSITVPAGEAAGTIRVPILSNGSNEETKTFFVNISNPSPALPIEKQQGVGTILDNDPLISVSATPVQEGNSGSTVLALTMRASGLYDRSVQVSYRTTNGTATAGIDYAPRAGTNVLTPGRPMAEITIPINGDTTSEGDETFSVVLSNPTNAAVANNTFLATILNDDGLSGELDHFAWNAITSPQYLELPIAVGIAARDAGDQPVTNFAQAVALDALADAQDITVGVPQGTWTYPLLATSHDVRLQTIYLAREFAGRARFSALALDVTALPGTTLSNWTVRMKHTTQTNYPVLVWDSENWIAVYQTNLTVTSTGWVTFPFQTPFEYDGTNNIIVDFSFNNAASASAGQSRYRTVLGSQRSIYFQVNSTAGDPLGWSGITPQPSATARVPIIRLTANPILEVLPASTSPFSGAEWQGEALLRQPGTIMLRASDNDGHFGLSAPITVELPQDTDADELPDPWELRYFTSLAQIGSDDADSDGISNYDEYRSGTNPADPQSHIRIVSAEISGADVRIRFTSAIGKQYRVEHASDPTSDDWTSFAIIVGTGQPRIATDLGGTLHAQRFYRVALVTP